MEKRSVTKGQGCCYAVCDKRTGMLSRGGTAVQMQRQVPKRGLFLSLVE